VETWGVAILSIIALLTFFFPLISMRIPVAGDQGISGYDIVSKVGTFTQNLSSGAARGNQPPGGSGVSLPLSVRMAWLVPLLVFAAFAGAALALIGAFRNLSLSKTASAIGAVCGVVAVIYITVLNSDVHNMLQGIMNKSATELKDNPFADLAKTIGSLLMNAFQLKPGAGLYVLVVCLCIVAFLAQTRFLTRVHLD